MPGLKRFSRSNYKVSKKYQHSLPSKAAVAAAKARAAAAMARDAMKLIGSFGSKRYRGRKARKGFRGTGAGYLTGGKYTRFK